MIVYIREAHAIDGRAPAAAPGDPLIEEPISLEERGFVAEQCVAALNFQGIPTVVDGMDNAVAKAYAAAPDRLYLVGKDGTIAYRGGRGPWGFLPDELEGAIRQALDETTPETVP